MVSFHWNYFGMNDIHRERQERHFQCLATSGNEKFAKKSSLEKLVKWKLKDSGRFIIYLIKVRHFGAHIRHLQIIGSDEGLKVGGKSSGGRRGIQTWRRSESWASEWKEGRKSCCCCSSHNLASFREFLSFSLSLARGSCVCLDQVAVWDEPIRDVEKIPQREVCISFSCTVPFSFIRFLIHPFSPPLSRSSLLLPRKNDFVFSK